MSRLSRLSGRTILFPVWLEPLWTLWQSTVVKGKERDLTEQEIAEAANRDVNLTCAPIALIEPNEDASIALGSELLKLIEDYPLPPAVLNPLAPKSFVDEDVDMDDAGAFSKDEAQTKDLGGTSRGKGGRGGRRGFQKAKAASFNGYWHRGIIPKIRLQSTDKAGRSAREARHFALRSRVPTPRPSATVGGEEVGWNSCGLCHTGKTGCSLVAPSSKGDSGAEITTQTELRGNSQRRQITAEMPAAKKSKPLPAAQATEASRPPSAFDDSLEEEPYPTIRPLTKPQAAAMLTMVKEHIEASEKKVIAKLEEQHAATLRQIAEMQQIVVTQTAGIAKQIKTFNSLFNIKQNDGDTTRRIKPVALRNRRYLATPRSPSNIPSLTSLSMPSTKRCDHSLVFPQGLSLISQSRFLSQLRELIEILHGNSEMPSESALPLGGILREELEKASEMLAAAKNNPSETPATLIYPLFNCYESSSALVSA
ncbi:hypothetical protein HWV62_43495 [Athelia sp. TMB]|nr:hypothetical protein HWV62_43495 [Athelia sp. TMB]